MDDILRDKAQRIRLAVFDVDGVFTDGRLYYGPDGEIFKPFHVRDGHGVKALQRAGIEVAIISGRNSPSVSYRMRELGVTHVHQGIGDKASCLNDLLRELNIAADAAACTGDDVPDLPMLERAGLAIAVPDGHAMVRAAAHWVTPHAGGQGAVRDVCDLLLQAAGRDLPRDTR